MGVGAQGPRAPPWIRHCMTLQLDVSHVVIQYLPSLLTSGPYLQSDYLYAKRDPFVLWGNDEKNKI